MQTDNIQNIWLWAKNNNITCSSHTFHYRGLSIAYSNATNVIAGVAFLIPMGFTNGAPTF